MSEIKLNPLAVSDPRLFEQMILCLVDRFRSVYDRYSKVLCMTDGQWRDDFDIPLHNALYRALAGYHDMMGGTSDYPPVSPQLLRALLLQEAAMGSANIGLSDMDEALETMEQIRQLDPGSAMCVVMSQMQGWLQSRRLNKIARKILAMDSMDPALIIDEVTAVGRLSRGFGNGKTTFSFGECMEQEIAPRQRYPIAGFGKTFNDVMGKGFAKGEFSLFLAPTGGGKTVLALQIAVGLSMSGLRVVFVTTEQPPDELEPRIVSARCNVPFEQVRDGVSMRKLTSFQRESIGKLKNNLNGKLLIEDWSQTRGLSIQSDLRDLLDRLEAEHGPIDALVFDWLGGALGELSKSDMHVYRLLIHNTGEVLGSIAAERDIIVVSFAQVNVKQAWNRKKVDITMAAECKSIGNKASNIYGISCMVADDADANDMQASYKDEQYLFASKSRKARGMGCKLWRDFDYQRFTTERPKHGPVAVNNG